MTNENPLWKDWYIVTSKTGYTKDGIPMGEVLCTNKREVSEYLDLAEDGDVTEYIRIKGVL